MNAITPIQQIDFVLSLFKKDRVYSAETLRREITAHEVVEKRKYDINGPAIHRILEKLVRDQLVYPKETIGGFNYSITIEGYLFIGYENTAVLKDKEIRSAKNSALEAKTYANRLLLATWFAGAGAILLLLWQVWIWFYPVHKDYPYWFWEKTPVVKTK